MNEDSISGQRAFEVYRRAYGEHENVDTETDGWDALPPECHAAWEAVARDVSAAERKRCAAALADAARLTEDARGFVLMAIKEPETVLD